MIIIDDSFFLFLFGLVSPDLLVQDVKFMNRMELTMDMGI